MLQEGGQVPQVREGKGTRPVKNPIGRRTAHGGSVLRPGYADKDRFERSKRISWLDMDLIAKQNVLVVGADCNTSPLYVDYLS